MSEQALVKSEPQPVSLFFDPQAFEHVQRVAKMFNQSDIVPEQYRGPQNLGNCVIALDMARRLGASPLAVMQHTYVVYGKPGWDSQFIISCVNSCRKFSPLRFLITDLGEKEVEYEFTVYKQQQKTREKGKLKIADKRCIAWAIELATGERLESPPVTVEMAVKEGWYTKNDSKWRTMPELMLRYRAGTFFGRLYAPELLMGMRSMDEIIDVEHLTEKDVTPRSTFGSAAPEEVKAITTTEAAPETPQARLGAFLKAMGTTFDSLLQWMHETGKLPDPYIIGSVDELNDDFCNDQLAAFDSAGEKSPLGQFVKKYEVAQ